MGSRGLDLDRFMLRKFSVRLCQIVLFCKRELPSLHVFIRDVARFTGKRVESKGKGKGFCMRNVSN